MTTDIVHQWIAEAREQAAQFDRAVVVDTAYRGSTLFPWYDPAAEAPAGTRLADVLAFNGTAYQRLFVWPSGLVAGPDRVNWIWDFAEARRGPRFLLGFARQAEAYAWRVKVGVDEVWGVEAHRIHGTCVFTGGSEFGPWYGADSEQEEHEEWNDWHHRRYSGSAGHYYNPYDWRMVQAVSLP